MTTAVLLPPIDLKELAGIANTSPEGFTREMLSLFQDSEAQTARQLRDLIKTEDRNAVARAAHTAKGTARFVFAGRLAGLCEDMEKTAKDGDWPAIHALMPGIEQEFQNVFQFIAQHLEDAKAK